MSASSSAVEFEGITSLLVSRSGDLVHEQYLEGERNTLRDTRSCTKTVLGMIVGMAIERGLIGGVQVRLGELLTDRSIDSDKAAITVEQLLTMHSPLECDDWEDGSPGNEERMYPTEDWVQFALDLPLRRDAGFSYCTAGVVVLGVAVAAALGERLSTFAERELFPAVGIEHFKWPTTPRGEDSCAGGLLLTSRGLLGLGNLYLEGGRDVVRRGWIEASTRAYGRIDDRTEYGRLWWLRSFAGHASYYMTGTGGNRVHVFPDLELVVVITTRNFNIAGAHARTDRLLTGEVLERYAI